MPARATAESLFSLLRTRATRLGLRAIHPVRVAASGTLLRRRCWINGTWREICNSWLFVLGNCYYLARAGRQGRIQENSIFPPPSRTHRNASGGFHSVTLHPDDFISQRVECRVFISYLVLAVSYMFNACMGTCRYIYMWAHQPRSHRREVARKSVFFGVLYVLKKYGSASISMAALASCELC